MKENIKKTLQRTGNTCLFCLKKFFITFIFGLILLLLRIVGGIIRFVLALPIGAIGFITHLIVMVLYFFLIFPFSICFSTCKRKKCMSFQEIGNDFKKTFYSRTTVLLSSISTFGGYSCIWFKKRNDKEMVHTTKNIKIKLCPTKD